LSQEIDRQEIAIRYLLGDLSKEEKTRLEEQYFLDDAEFEQLEIAEDELIDRYVRKELSAEDARRFEKLLGSPGISERVEVARLIAKRTAQVHQPAPAPVGWWQRLFGPSEAAAFRPAFAMSLILLLLTPAFIFVWMKLRTESQQLAQEQQQRENLRREMEEQKVRLSELEAKLDKTQQEKEEQAELAAKYRELLAEEQQRSVPAVTFPIFLSPGSGSRGSGGNDIPDVTIPHGVPQVGLNLNVTHGGDDYPLYNASVKNIDSKGPLITKTRLRPISQRGRKYIRINLDASLLRAGSYTVHVDGITATGQTDTFEDYFFRIKSR